ncbi:MAG: hypothetical protein Kow00114_38660 [Kiloniellaceae bacterium]
MTPSQDPLSVARAALQPGETLLWADRPDPRVLARARLPQCIRGVLGLVVIGGFLGLSFIPDWPEGLRGLLLGLFVAAALAYALWLAAAPLLASREAAQTVYAVTDRRVLVLADWPRRRWQTFGPGDLDEILVAPALPGLGTVVFVNRKLPWWRRGLGNNYRIEAFFGIPDAQEVAARIDALKAAAAPEAQPPGDSGSQR